MTDDITFFRMILYTIRSHMRAALSDLSPLTNYFRF